MDPNQNQPNNTNDNDDNLNPEPPQPGNSWSPQSIVGAPEGNTTAPVQPSYNGLSGVPSPRKSRKKLFIGLASLFVIVGLSAGGVFAYYLPNKPENVYKTGMERSGEVIDKLIDQSTKKEKLEEIKTGEIDGSLDFSSNEASFSGTFNTKLDRTKSENRLDVKLKQAGKL